MWKFSSRSLKALEGVDERLINVVKRALELSQHDFGVSEGVRTLERQKELLKAGKSRTMRSKHLEGKAVDIFVLKEGKVTWEWKYYEDVSKAFKQASEELDIPIQWGGDWVTFKDGPHYQLKE